MSKAACCLCALLLVGAAACQQGSDSSTPKGSTATSASTMTPSAEAPSATAKSPTATTGAAGEHPAGSEETTMPSGLKYVDIKVGDGAIAEDGMTATVHYTGWLTNGTKFDSSLDRGQPFDFKLGAGQVIRGWDEGVKGMRVGGKRKLTIPPDLGYGERGTGGGAIPPNATLVFDVELLGVK